MPLPLHDPAPPGETGRELTGPTAAHDAQATAALASAMATIGRPYHKGCGRRTDREGTRFRCLEHGLVEWHETTYDAEKA